MKLLGTASAPMLRMLMRCFRSAGAAAAKPAANASTEVSDLIRGAMIAQRKKGV